MLRLMMFYLVQADLRFHFKRQQSQPYKEENNMAQIDIGKLTFTHKGDYAGGTAYVANDVVYYNGSAYIAKTSTTVISQRVRSLEYFRSWFRRNMECWFITWQRKSSGCRQLRRKRT